jgi:hypothetical protein
VTAPQQAIDAIDSSFASHLSRTLRAKGVLRMTHAPLFRLRVKGVAARPAAAPREGQQAAVGPGFVEEQQSRPSRLLVVQTGSLAPARAHALLSMGGAARGRGRHASRWRRCRADLGSRVRSHGRGERARGLAGEPPGRGRSRRSLGRDHWAGAQRVPGRACGFAHVGRASLHRSAAALDGGWGA